jgi:hypothetical protein
VLQERRDEYFTVSAGLSVLAGIAASGIGAMITEAPPICSAARRRMGSRWQRPCSV